MNAADAETGGLAWASRLGIAPPPASPSSLAAALVAFGATQAWATGVGTLLGRLSGLTINGSLGFDVLLVPGGQYGNVKPLLLGCAAALAVLALLLFATRVRGLGVLWRLLALATLVVLGLTAVAAWSVVNRPASVIADSESPLGEVLDFGVFSVLESTSLATVEPGVGLWLLTAGCAIVGIGALIPAGRGRTVETATGHLAPRAPLRAGCLLGGIPTTLDSRFVRFFDGMQWTGVTRPRT